MGHVTDRSVLASLEYGAEHLHTPLLVVMGHESCGVVKAAMDTPATTSQGPNLSYLLKAIRPAVARAATQPATIRLRAAILANVEETINQLLDSSTALKGLAEGQRLTMVGAYYELATGRVHFSEPVRLIPRQPTAAGAPASSRTGGAGKPGNTPPPTSTRTAPSAVTKPQAQ
jgi:carbonic anhydrase